MRSKKWAVQFGLLVMLMSLSAAAASDLGQNPLATTGSNVTTSSYTSPFIYRRVATPKASWKITWRGAVVLTYSCKTSDATIRYTYASEGKVAPYPTSSSRVLPYGYGLYLTKPCMVRAKAFKSSWLPSVVSRFTWNRS